MKNLTPLIFLATLSALAILAVVSSVTGSVPFVPTAAYIVGGGGSLGLIAVFLGDYTRSSSRHAPSSTRVRKTRSHLSVRDARVPAPAAPRAAWPAVGIHHDHATLAS